MTDLSNTVAAKSNQLNADDLISGTKTIVITNVSAVAGEQPIAISYEGDGGKPFMPCKSMRRVLIQVWGADGKKYVGRSMTLYRDPSVKFGGIAVGGIRISHMSHITEKKSFPLTESRASRKLYTVLPLKVEPPKHQEPASESEIIERIEMAQTMEALQATWKMYGSAIKHYQDNDAEAAERIEVAKDNKKQALSSPPSELAKKAEDVENYHNFAKPIEGMDSNAEPDF